MYGEPFTIPQPDELVGISNFAGGEVFRSICCWRRGRGRLIYLRPGDNRYPTLYHDEYRQLIANAVHYALPPTNVMPACHGNRAEPIRSE